MSREKFQENRKIIYNISNFFLYIVHINYSKIQKYGICVLIFRDKTRIIIVKEVIL